jgi:Na+/proline symporter
LALVITDAIQGMFCFPLIVVFVVFILFKFSWSNEIVPVMMDRVSGESFINPYDLSNLRDFNLFAVVVTVFGLIIGRASWIGGGTTVAAKSPHEQKMAGLLGTWRGAISFIFYVLIAITVITLMNHRSFAPQAKLVRNDISSYIAKELVPDNDDRKVFNARINAIPAQYHQIGVDKPLSQESNLDTPILNVAHEMLKEFEVKAHVKTLGEVQGKIKGEAQGNDKFQQYRTLFHQMMLASSMRQMLPPGLLGLFCLLMVLAMISTDDSRMYSSALTITQDIILPLKKKSLTPKQHVWTLRLVTICIGIFFFCGSYFMAQLDYINLFVTIMCALWLGGCGPVMIFGLYSRFGTTAGAFTSLITGMIMSVSYILVKRNWAAMVYPWLESHGWVDKVGNFLTSVSSPFNPYIKWEMDAVKFPINSYEVYFMTMVITLFLYIVVSYCTMKKPFNLDRMLHRGIYNIDHDKAPPLKWSFSTVYNKLIGITTEYTTGDKVIAWSFFFYSFVFQFVISFVVVVIWNSFSPWPIAWWGKYFFVTFLIIPGIMAVISTFWFGIGGFIDLLRLFRDLKARKVNHLDNGQIDGHVSLADKAEFDKLEHEKPENKLETEE